MVRETIIKTIKKHSLIENGDLIIIGLSGGPDSMCLMDNLYNLCNFSKDADKETNKNTNKVVNSEKSEKEKIDFQIVIAHVSHNFREIDGRKDMEFVKKVGEKYNLKTHIKEVDCPKMAEELKLSSEEAGRKARYEFFNEITQEYVKKGFPKEKIKIAIAHNMEDQSETILFRILRGSGLDGLAGIGYKSQNSLGNTVIRPLLDVKRTEIEKYCERNSLDARIDKTNGELLYTRNKIRLELIPYINKKFSVDLKKSLCNLGENIRSDKEFLWQEAEKAYKEALISENIINEAIANEAMERKAVKVVFSQEKLQTYHNSIVFRVLLKAFKKIGLEKDISKAHIDKALSLIKESKTPKEINLPQGHFIEIAYKKVTCIKREKRLKILKNTGEIPIDRIDIIHKTKTSKNNASRVENANEVTIKEFKDGSKYYEYLELRKNIDNVKNISGTGKKSKYNYIALDLDKIKEKYGIDQVEEFNIFEKFQVRTRETGDFIRLKGMNGRKKIQDLFVDMKVPRNERDEIPMVCIRNEVLWILSRQCKMRKNCEFTLDNDTKHIVLLEFFENLC